MKKTLNRENRKIINVLIGISILFLALSGYLTYYTVFKGPTYITSSYNRRQLMTEEKVLRGTIFDRGGIVLAKSEMKGDSQVRVYPYNNLYSQVIGYNSHIYGKSMLEQTYNSYLTGSDDYGKVMNTFGIGDSKVKTGEDIYLTIDHDIQQLGRKLLGNRNGAIVAMDPKTGEIIAMVSNPDFNANEDSLEKNWQNMTEDENSPFVARATRGLYAPGSTFKVAIAALAIENGLDKLEFQDEGTVTIDGKAFSNSSGKAYGKIDITRGLAVSSNVVFSQLGVKLGEEKLRDMANRLGVNKDIPFDISVSKSSFPTTGNMSTTDIAAAAIGQGKLLVTPLHMAMLTSAIANDGVMMEPVLVSKVVAHNGYNVKTAKQSELYTVMDKETAEKLGSMMQEAVKNGTAAKAAIKGIAVAGKTGTAQNEKTATQKDKEHAWFIAYAPADDPAIAISILLEYQGGSGGNDAAPIAKKIMSEYLK